jgi:putative transposase
VACRGRARQGGRICASDILHRHGQWFLSLTIEPATIERERSAHGAIALDWGVETLLSCVSESGVTEKIENPRWHQSGKDRIASLQRSVSRKKRGSNRRKTAARRLREAQQKQARRRLDMLHKISNAIARRNAIVAMEDLSVKNMTRSASGTVIDPGKNVAQKAGLNREILDTAPALLMQLLRYKVKDTGGMWVEAPAKKLKPSQTCPVCGHQHKKSLSDRMHECLVCGHREPRDTASARVVLNWALYGTPFRSDPGVESRRGTA